MEPSYKIVLIGDSNVGKTSFAHWIIHNKRLDENSSTVGAAYYTYHHKNLNGSSTKISIWDTAGQERFKALTRLYYKSTDACFVMFDVTNRESFDNLESWILDYKYYNDTYCVVYIVANKCDYDKSCWRVSEQEIRDFSKEYNYPVFFVNCMDGTNVENAITDVVTKLESKLESELEFGSDLNNQSFLKINLEDNNSPKKSKCAC